MTGNYDLTGIGGQATRAKTFYSPILECCEEADARGVNAGRKLTHLGPEVAEVNLTHLALSDQGAREGISPSPALLGAYRFLIGVASDPA
jgi:hypothetical protein